MRLFTPETVACPSGCVGGAGQPHGLMGTKKERTERNPVVNAFLERYGEEECHKLLHVYYPD